MKQINSVAGVFGPFSSVETLSDRFRCDGVDFPFGVIGAATVEDWVQPAHVVTDAERTALLKQIDADTDAIYAAVQGSRASEYQQAEMDANAYKAAGYAGAVPGSVQSWATAKAQTPTWAADDILATAVAWRGAMASIRAHRLLRKEQGRAAEDLAPVAAGWAGFVAAIRAALGVA